MSSELLIDVSKVSKAFKVFERAHHRLLDLVTGGNESAQTFQALQDISFRVHRGEAVGIIGRNGSGKSTLLQIVCGTLQPSSGSVSTHGRIAALLELGAGFNPEFTGRENVHLNASLLGMSKAEIDNSFQSILDFAEIGEYVEQPVKTYSSGMYVRLAFAVAIHCKPDILIVDEALAVGDVYFQRKCYRKIDELRERGCTLLLVTHSMDSLLQICDRGILLEGGHLLYDGSCKKAADEYMRCLFGTIEEAPDSEVAEDQLHENSDSDQESVLEPTALQILANGGAKELFAARHGYNRDENRLGSRSVTLCDFAIESGNGTSSTVFSRETFDVYAKYRANDDVARLIFGLQVRSVDGLVIYSTNSLVATGDLYEMKRGDVRVVRFGLRCNLLPGQYFLTIGCSQTATDDAEIHAIDRRMDSVILNVLGGMDHTNGHADLEISMDLDVSEDVG